MNLKAYKMNGLGNDFVIIDARSEEIELSNDQITKICDREYICLLYTSPSPRDA